MKIEWEASDIRPGVIVGKENHMERWMIGYVESFVNERRFTLNSLSDGRVLPSITKEELAHHLNASGDVPFIK